MLRALYNDFRFDYRIYADHVDPAAIYTGPDVLLVSHELSLTGAPLMLMYARRPSARAAAFPWWSRPRTARCAQALVAPGSR